MDTKPDIIKRLNDPEMCIDAIDDAARELQKLRSENLWLLGMLKFLKVGVLAYIQGDEWNNPKIGRASCRERV